MTRSLPANTNRPVRLRRDRSDLRLVFSLLLVAGILTASTVVSADAWLRVPSVWLTADTAAEPTPTPVLEFPTRTVPQVDQPAETGAGPSPEAVAPVEEPNTVPVHRLSPHDYAESWRQADDDIDRLGETMRSHRVTVSRDGHLSGRLIGFDSATGEPEPLDGARLWFSSRGLPMKTDTTDETGRFEVTGLQAGTYAVFASDAEVILAFSMHVQVVEAEHDTQHEIELRSPAVTGIDTSIVLAQLAAAPHIDAPRLQQVEPDDNHLPEAVRSIKQRGAFATPILTHAVQLRPGGRLVGRVRRLHPQSGRPLIPSLTRVTLIQDGVRITSTYSDDIGWFAFTNMEPGVYSLAAVTVDEAELIADAGDGSQPVGLLDKLHPPGIAAFAVRVLPADRPAEAVITPFPSNRYLADGEQLELDFALIDQSSWFAFTRDRGLERTTRSLASRTSSGSRGLAPRALSQPSPMFASNAPVGGSGSSSVPFVPPDDGTSNQTVSPALP